MPVADFSHGARSRRLCGRAMTCALLLGGALVLAPGLAAAASSHGHGGNHQTTTTSDDSPSSASSPSSSDHPTDPNAPATPSTPGSGPNAGNGTGTGGSRGASGSGETSPFNPAPGHASVSVGFNNDGASVGIHAPIGAAPHAVTPIATPAPHPIFSFPIGRPGPAAEPHGLSHALAYGESPLAAPGGASSMLTTRLIHSVTSTLSDHFANTLGHSLRGETTGTTAAATPALNRTPAEMVRDRFMGVDTNAFEPRMFSLPTGESHYVANEVVVGVPSDLPAPQLAAFAQRNGLAAVDNGVAAAGVTLQRWRITDARPVGDVIRALQADADVQAAQPNYRFRLAQQAGLAEAPASELSVQYAQVKLHLAQAHELSTGQGVLVAVIDTGIDGRHPEIAGAIVKSYDAIGSGDRADGHGTGIAGAIVAHDRLTGVAPNARLLAIRAFDNSGPDAEATTMTIVRSIEWAMAQGARVINMSFAGARDPLIARSVAAARRKGIVLVAAAGNGGPNSPPLYPAADPNVIAVSATDVDDHLLEQANRGGQIAIAAPGVELLLPAPGGRYQMATGTSFAAAHIAGIAALMIARNPRLTPEQVRAALTTTARDLGPKGRDDMFGAGLADAYKAVLAVGAGGAPTLASVSSVPISGPVSAPAGAPVTVPASAPASTPAQP